MCAYHLLFGNVQFLPLGTISIYCGRADADIKSGDEVVTCDFVARRRTRTGGGIAQGLSLVRNPGLGRQLTGKHDVRQPPQHIPYHFTRP